jgi:hypothetical protein
MPRGENPLDSHGGPLSAFAGDLRALRAEAGQIPYRVLAKRAGYSASTLSMAASGRSMPSLDVTLAYVQACGGDPEVWKSRWQELMRTMAAPDVSPAAGRAEPAVSSRALWHRRWVQFAIGATVIAGVAVAATMAVMAAGNSRDGASANHTVARGGHRTPGHTHPAANYRYDQTTGPGCPDVALATVGRDDSSPDHHWVRGTAVGWAVANCSDLFLYSELTSEANPDRWQDDYEWYFNNVPAAAACTFHIYIAPSQYSAYRSAIYDWTPGTPDYLEADAFTVDQIAERGRWYAKGPVTLRTGKAMLELTDARIGEADRGTLTAAAVRLTCV